MTTKYLSNAEFTISGNTVLAEQLLKEMTVFAERLDESMYRLNAFHTLADMNEVSQCITKLYMLLDAFTNFERMQAFKVECNVLSQPDTDKE